MASGIIAVLDDIAALMDDVAIASKVAGKKTAGLLGDDLAVNAEKATGFVSSREIPVLWAITKGSFVNKLIIVPVALLLNAFFPVLIKYILILGGIYLAYEGAEKIYEYLFHRKSKSDEKVVHVNLEKIEEDLEAEKLKIRSAVVTDFILSVEIVIIALSAVTEEVLYLQIITVSIIAIVATVGVYGLVALIVRMDDVGYKLIQFAESRNRKSYLGHFLVAALPWVIKTLSVVGTIALILVSGGIFAHNIDYFHHSFTEIPSILKEFLLGLIIGFAAFVILHFGKKLFSKGKEET